MTQRNQDFFFLFLLLEKSYFIVLNNTKYILKIKSHTSKQKKWSEMW